MSLTTTTEEVAGRVPFTVLALEGELDASNFERLVSDARDLYSRGARALLIDLLRGELGFEGVIVSDAAGMVGLASRVGPEERAVASIECDAFILAGSSQHALSGEDEQDRNALQATADVYAARTHATVVVTDVSGMAVAVSGDGLTRVPGVHPAGAEIQRDPHTAALLMARETVRLDPGTQPVDALGENDRLRGRAGSAGDIQPQALRASVGCASVFVDGPATAAERPAFRLAFEAGILHHVGTKHDRR